MDTVLRVGCRGQRRRGKPYQTTAEFGSVELVDVTKRFSSVVAFDGIDLGARVGEFLSLIGPSGCGKTTTLRMLAGFEEPDEERSASPARTSADRNGTPVIP